MDKLIQLKIMRQDRFEKRSQSTTGRQKGLSPRGSLHERKSNSNKHCWHELPWVLALDGNLEPVEFSNGERPASVS